MRREEESDYEDGEISSGEEEGEDIMARTWRHWAVEHKQAEAHHKEYRQKEIDAERAERQQLIKGYLEDMKSKLVKQTTTPITVTIAPRGQAQKKQYHPYQQSTKPELTSHPHSRASHPHRQLPSSPPSLATPLDPNLLNLNSVYMNADFMAGRQFLVQTPTDLYMVQRVNNYQTQPVQLMTVPGHMQNPQPMHYHHHPQQQHQQQQQCMAPQPQSQSSLPQSISHSSFPPQLPVHNTSSATVPDPFSQPSAPTHSAVCIEDLEQQFDPSEFFVCSDDDILQLDQYVHSNANGPTSEYQQLLSPSSSSVTGSSAPSPSEPLQSTDFLLPELYDNYVDNGYI